MPTAKARANAELAQNAFDAVNKRDLETLIAFDAPDIVENVLPTGTLYGRDAVRQYFVELFAAMPDAALTVERIVSDDTTAVVQWHLQGTFSGAAYQGIEPTGKDMSFRGVDAMEIQHGLIQRNTIYYDGLDVARQMGLLPRKDSSADKTLMQAFNAFTKIRRRLG